ncbi:MAG: glycosyltransferase [Elusimicrobia bacterium]|nr:glycosyltransferase [Elusimicrobiota bacterium]
MTQPDRPPRVSVVIPAFNAAAFLEETLDSVRAQTYRDYEVVVVDDGSKDDTHRVATSYLERHGLPGKAILQRNKKIAGARNTGMRAAAGGLIALLDHDDLWRPRKLSAMVREFDLHPETALVGHHIAVTRDGKTVRVLRKGPAVKRMYERLLLGANAVSPSAAVFRKDLALQIGGFREDPEFNTVEDYDFWMRLSRIGTFRFVDEVLGEYPLRGSSASSRIDYHHQNLVTLLMSHFEEYFGDNPGLLDRLRMRKRLAAAYRSGLSQFLESGGDPQACRRYALKMLATYPFEAKNIVRALQWALRRVLPRWLRKLG